MCKMLCPAEVADAVVILSFIVVVGSEVGLEVKSPIILETRLVVLLRTQGNIVF